MLFHPSIWSVVLVYWRQLGKTCSKWAGSREEGADFFWTLTIRKISGRSRAFMGTQIVAVAWEAVCNFNLVKQHPMGYLESNCLGSATTDLILSSY